MSMAGRWREDREDTENLVEAEGEVAERPSVTPR